MASDAAASTGQKKDLTTEALRKVKDVIKNQRVSATYTCGGSIPIKSPADAQASFLSENAEDVTTSPITLRWDQDANQSSIAGSKDSKLTLPVDGVSGLSTLLNSMQIASFGLDGKDVVDLSYRKASKMDTSQFCTDFNPYTVGICDAIAQVLMPSVKGSGSVRSIRAELYKLNVYSAPSGKFQAHVDTPSSPSQFGSLVVCFPCSHQGGQLLVKHAGQVMTYDWSGSANLAQNQAVKWAAFYSDCEHEVLEVTEGHRVTLTYNLHFSTSPKTWTERQPIDATTLPLYAVLKDLLIEPRFMKKGGTLAIPCSHAYAHAAGKKLNGLPATLKGVDMAMVEAFSALGLKPRLRPILDGAERYEYESADEDEMYDDNMYDDDETSDGEADVQLYPEFKPAKAVVGTDMHNFDTAGEEEMDEFSGLESGYNGLFPSKLEKVTWLRHGKSHRTEAFAALAYGNNYSLDVKYSYAAILATIPPSSKRPVY